MINVLKYNQWKVLRCKLVVQIFGHRVVTLPLRFHLPCLFYVLFYINPLQVSYCIHNKKSNGSLLWPLVINKEKIKKKEFQLEKKWKLWKRKRRNRSYNSVQTWRKCGAHRRGFIKLSYLIRTFNKTRKFTWFSEGVNRSREWNVNGWTTAKQCEISTVSRQWFVEITSRVLSRIFDELRISERDEYYTIQIQRDVPWNNGTSNSLIGCVCTPPPPLHPSQSSTTTTYARPPECYIHIIHV